MALCSCGYCDRTTSRSPVGIRDAKEGLAVTSLRNRAGLPEEGFNIRRLRLQPAVLHSERSFERPPEQAIGVKG
jgi:hypothetical protein